MKVVCLVGSPRGQRSTSQVLGTLLLESLERRGAAGSLWRVNEMREREGLFADFCAALAGAELLVLSFPLYVDTLPADLIRVLGWLAAGREELPLAGKRLVALANSGFPEAEQNDIALDQCARFARECGLQWSGGLALGGGAALNGRPLSDFGAALRHVQTALDGAATALAEGRAVPDEAIQQMAHPFMPAWAYLNLGASKRPRKKAAGLD